MKRLARAPCSPSRCSPPPPRSPRRRGATTHHASRWSPTTRSRCRSRCSRRSPSRPASGEDPACRGRRQRAEPGDPHEGRPARRRVLRRRQHVPQPSRRRGDVRALRIEGAGKRPGRVPARRHAPPHADRPRRRVHQRRQAVVRDENGRRAVDTRRPHEARLRRSPRRGERRDVVARARVPARDDRPLRRERLAGLLGAAARQRRHWSSTDWTSAFEGELLAGRRRGHPPARRVVRVEPAGGGVLLEAAAEDVADRRRCSTHASSRSSSRACSRAPSTAARHERSSTSCCRSAFQEDIPLQMFVFPVRDGTRIAAGVREVRRGRAEPVVAPARRDRRQPRPVDRAVDRAPCCGDAARGSARAGATRRLAVALVPGVFLAVFFVYPVGAIVGTRARAGRRRSTSPLSPTSSRTRRCGTCCGSPSGRRRCRPR